MGDCKHLNAKMELERLISRHKELDSRLEELSKRRHLSQSEELEIKKLKRQKLYTKDAITLLKTKSLQ
ncbi:MAG: hypothetical protein Kow0090_20760 [Myxococcota bacterium]